MSHTSKIQQLENELSDLKVLLKRTAEYQAEKDLLESEYQRSQQRFKVTFEKSAVGKNIINNQLEIVNVNTAMLKMLGYSEAEMLGNIITNFAHPDFVDHWKQLQHELWTTALPSFNFDTCLIKKNGDAFWAHVTTIQIEDDGNTLGYTIIEDISERKELEHLRELLRQQDQRHQIAEAIFNAQENERKRIAESLHNGLGQLLYGVKLSLNQVSVKQGDETGILSALDGAQKLLADCIRECRSIAHDLMPAMLEEHGLKQATQDICRQLSGDTFFECRIKGFDKKLDGFLEVAIYRMIQELMMNVVKHASASQAVVNLSEGGEHITIQVEDNGKGFADKASTKNGIGMQTIRYKVALLNGKLTIASKKGKGTKVKITLPKKKS